jgi:hypothetical protein
MDNDKMLHKYETVSLVQVSIDINIAKFSETIRVFFTRIITRFCGLVRLC